MWVVMRSRLLLPPVLALVACTSTVPPTEETDGPSSEAEHTHAGPGGAMVSLPVGDGTRAEEVGYRLADVRLPARAGASGVVGFDILDHLGRPVEEFLPEQTRDLHLYVVRDDLEVFRHLHPTQDGDGRWSAPVTLPAGGSYRVVTEFVAKDTGGNGDHILLGAEVPVRGDRSGAPAVLADDGTVEADVEITPRVGRPSELTVAFRDSSGGPVKLGTYLGSFAHLSAFHERTGGLEHMHPLGSPEVAEDGTRLSFHTELDEPGRYVVFVQVRVDGFLHTLRTSMTVTTG